MVSLSVGGALIKNISLMIFDKDGTLMELHHYWSKMVGLRAEMICERLGLDDSHIKRIALEMGADINTGRLRPGGPVGLKKREIVMQAAIDYLSAVGFDDTYSMCTDVFKEIDEISSRDLSAFVRPIPGAEKLIRDISRKGCKVAIATTDRHERARLAMEFLGFVDALDVIIGADDVKMQKPDPEQIELILNAFGIARSNAVMVGDALTDVQMGTNARLQASIGLLTGLVTYDELAKVTPYVVSDISKIQILSQEGGSE